MAGSHVIVGHPETTRIFVRRIGRSDIRHAVAKGIEDFAAMPSHAIFLCLIYPVVGLALGRLVVGADVLPLLFPLAAGFALIGPFAAVGLYELSRRRENGLEARFSDAFGVVRSPSFGAILGLGLLLMVIFLVWLAVAQAIYVANFGYAPAASIPDFVDQLFTTEAGRNVVIFGNLIGFLFALLVLSLSVVSFPLLLDRDVGAATAILTSIRAVIANPAPMALWGLIVALALVLGSLPFFLGLAVVVPVLGHATWHLYRRMVPR